MSGPSKVGAAGTSAPASTPVSTQPTAAPVTTVAIAPAAPAVIQYQLFARKAEIQYPPKTVTADSLGEVEADDQFRYFVKGDAHGKLVRASEWLGTHIAEEVRISAPTPMPIELLDGTIVFGSRSIAGVSDFAITVAYLTTPTLANTSRPATGLQAVLSATYALDLFIFNDDRHAGNYLSIDDNGTRRFYTFDFSRAVFWQWPWNHFPPATCNTRVVGGMLRRLHGFDVSAAVATLDRLAALPIETLKGFINRMPPDWLPEPVRSEFITWWSSPDRQQRIDTIKRGIADGSLL